MVPPSVVIKDGMGGRGLTRCNMKSITGRPWLGGDVNKWLLPYAGDAADPALVRRVETLASGWRIHNYRCDWCLRDASRSGAATRRSNRTALADPFVREFTNSPWTR